MKRQAAHGVKIFEKSVSNKRLVSLDRIYKVLSKFTNKSISLENGRMHDDTVHRGDI